MLKETTRPGCGDTGEAAVQFMEAGIQGVGAVRGESPFPGLIGGNTDSPGGASALKQKLNVLPWPNVLSIQILPPCPSTIPFAIASPRPAPSLSVRDDCQ